MKRRSLTALSAGAALALVPAYAYAQRPQPTPEQRIDRLERQVQQVQRQLFPRGRPAETAGFADEPAATQSSVATLDQRLDALERQMSDILRQSEENGHRLQTMASDLQRARDEQQQRINALEQRIAEAAASTPTAPQIEPAATLPTKPATNKPTPGKPGTTKPSGVNGGTAATGGSLNGAPAADAGEAAYTQGFKLWEAGQDEAAIRTLRAFTAAYPKHRRVSYANNIIGRSLLDKGDARGAAEALLANYRNNPKGERAADSLYYLGQALLKLGQPAQACKAYAELDAVYGSKVRPDLRKLVDQGKASAQCS